MHEMEVPTKIEATQEIQELEDSMHEGWGESDLNFKQKIGRAWRKPIMYRASSQKKIK